MVACDKVRNITLSVPDEVYRRARRCAAEQGTSVSAMVGRYLRSLTDQDTEFVRLEALQQRVLDEIDSFRGADRLPRERLHDRAVR